MPVLSNSYLNLGILKRKYKFQLHLDVLTAIVFKTDIEKVATIRLEPW